ncbi:hypothetical protein ACHAXT_005692 [Thalassiosira profunda]
MADGWISRKRPRKEAGGGVGSKGDAKEDAVGGNAPSLAPPPPAPSGIPASLAPHLGWTKMSACHRPRARRRQRSNWDKEEGVQKISGLAVFFIHNLQSEVESTDGGDGKLWFQGRFFPSTGTPPAAKLRESPASVSSERVAPSTTHNSWGLLAVQNEVVDECLTCAEGGYREMDLTFIRPKGGFANRGKKVRWVANDLVWTGGNMMSLSTDPYSPILSAEEPGVKFEPQKLMEGERAMEMAKKYFPSICKRMRISDAMNSDSMNDLDEKEDAMVVVGNMEVVAPASFARTRRVGFAFGNGASDDDGLWDD